MALIHWQPREAFSLNREIDNNQFWGDFGSRNGWYPKVELRFLLNNWVDR